MIWAFLLLCIGSICITRMFAIMPITRDDLFHKINEGVLILDKCYRLAAFNRASENMFAHLNQKMVGYPFAIVWRELFGVEFPLQFEIAAGNMVVQLSVSDHPPLRTYQVRTSVLQHDEDNKGYLVLFTDITELRRLHIELEHVTYDGERIAADMTKLKIRHTELEHLAFCDELTGIYNRRAFLQRGSQMLAEARQDFEAFTVVMMDVDYFKKVNDTYGHLTGDQLLVHVVQACRSQLQAGELFARYGGEEFVFARKSCGAVEGEAFAERMRMAAAQPFAASVGHISITVSLGVAEAGNGVEETLSQLLSKADEALYIAKQQGRNRVCVHGGSFYKVNGY
ncbi:GGDEF domain-containing protein [Paenibacillus sacheonensis]|uniref:Diguanylate cyclase n=1 Tax=Paenibacillus sacheonensis TaxID=742054 RepID=A0A7X4YX05_9BACL|nr:GGDEF domain-containing protein [Paenibacillus sacheonensis]MBM7569140.1 diguanylate cyclase (GGDEF)-like protein [Paenibacillus sacheonensis]NBC72974.1 diguanylate cyclase [Paenibacillus sacheonensis]